MDQSGSIGPADMAVLLNQFGLDPEWFWDAGDPAVDLAAWGGGGPHFIFRSPLPGLPPCAFQPGGCQFNWGRWPYGTGPNAGFNDNGNDGGGGDPGTGPGGGCPTCPPPPESLCPPFCPELPPCDDCINCDSDQDGWGNIHDCDSPCFNATNPCDCQYSPWDFFGPRFIGVNQSAGITAMPPAGCNQGGGAYTWTVTAGANLLQNGPVTTNGGNTTHLTAGGTPGTVVILFRYNKWGRVYEQTHTIIIVEYEPVTVRYTAFIPCQILAGPPMPPLVEGPAYFAGDDRSFSATASNYRVGYHKTMVISEHMPPSPNEIPLFNDMGFPVFGTSFGYPVAGGIASILVPGCPWQLAPGAVASVSTTLVPDGANWRFTLTQVAHNSAVINIHANASNPAYPFGSPPIRVEMMIDMAQEVDPDDGTQGMQFVLISGSRTFFPAHEAWINEHMIHSYDPRSSGIQPLEGLLNFRAIVPEPTGFTLP